MQLLTGYSGRDKKVLMDYCFGSRVPGAGTLSPLDKGKKMVHQAGFEPTTDGAAIFCGFKAGYYSSVIPRWGG